MCIRDSPIEVHAELGSPLPVPATVAAAVRQAAAEALHNVARHAGVAAARLRATVSPDSLAVEISDDGIGFELDLATPHQRGLTHSVLGRMAAVGGRARVRSHPGGGTTVRLEWPDAG